MNRVTQFIIGLIAIALAYLIGNNSSKNRLDAIALSRLLSRKVVQQIATESPVGFKPPREYFGLFIIVLLTI